VARSLNNLGIAYREEHKDLDAEELLQRSQAARSTRSLRVRATPGCDGPSAFSFDSALRVQGRAPDQGRPNHHQDEYRVVEWHEVGESGLIGPSTVGNRLGVPATTAWHLIPRVLPP
jgi:hypothetical protein